MTWKGCRARTAAGSSASARGTSGPRPPLGAGRRHRGGVRPARWADDVRFEAYGGPRDHLRPLFELTDPGDPRHAEVKNMAVRETRQGQGVGRRLIQAAVD